MRIKFGNFELEIDFIELSMIIVGVIIVVGILKS